MAAITQPTTKPTEYRLREGWITGILIALLLLTVSYSVIAADWADGLWILPWSGLGGLIVGAMFTRTRVPGWLAHPWATLIAAGGVAGLASLLLPGGLTWNDRVIILQDRLATWFNVALRGGISADNFIFVLQLTALVWLFGHIAAWTVLRGHQPWGAIIPTAAGLVVNLFYAPPQTGLYLVFFLLVALLLLVRTNLSKRENTWRVDALGYSSDIAIDFFTYSILLAALIIFVAWLVPPTAPGPQWLAAWKESVQGPWTDVEDTFSRLFSSLRAMGRPRPSNFFGQTLALGGPVHLGNRPVFDVKADSGHYWRAMVYDKYTGIGWISTTAENADFRANDPRLTLPPEQRRRLFTQTVKIFLPDDNLILAASQPAAIGLPTTARYTPIRPGLDVLWFDVAAIRSQKRMPDGIEYIVISSVSDADEDSLRSAISTLPGWVEERYLNLPDSLPPRVKALAERITANAKNEYDKAQALELWLRQNVVYNENVYAPPQNQDAVDYTLFVRREGYCNYYASAMAVMARTLGIPARVASGYAPGEYDSGTFHVKESDAHTWTEVYFPTYGWVEFEPTASKSEIVRPVKATPQPEKNAADETRPQHRPDRSDTDLENPNFRPGALPFAFSVQFLLANAVPLALGTVGLSALIALAVVQFAWSRYLRRLAPAARAYASMLHYARWLGIDDKLTATPFERAELITRALPDTRDGVARITALYVRERFGARALEADARVDLALTWTRLRVRLWRGIVVTRARTIVQPARDFFSRAYSTIRARFRNTRTVFTPRE